MASSRVYQFYAGLVDFSPKIWRRFQVRCDATMARLGYVLQVLFEMEAGHLMAFELPIRNNYKNYLLKRVGMRNTMELMKCYDDPTRICRIELPNGEIDPEYDYPADVSWANAALIKICDIVDTPEDILDFFYDFGDGWHVKIKLEEVLEAERVDSRVLPRVIDGQNFGIVDDVGGVDGLGRLAKAYEKKTGTNYQHYRCWLGEEDFDITQFDKDDMNYRLKKIPRVYMQVYEQFLKPTQQSLNLINRKYKKR